MLAKFLAIPHHTYLIMKMPAPNGILSVLGDIMVSYNCESATVELSKVSAIKATATVMVAQAAKIDQTTLQVPEQKCTSTTLDPSPAVKKVCLGLPDASKEVVIGADLDPKQELALTSFLRDNADIFAWSPSDMPGVPRELAEHRLEVSNTARPIKQKLRRFAKDRKQAIEVEVCKLLAAGFIRECQHPVWLANPVLLPKKTGGLRMCIDYTDLNKHCPKNPFPLPYIDQVMDSTASSVLLCFLDCYSGYHQIALHPDEEDKTAFITPHSIDCYKVMTFGLKNAGATYQKAIQKCLKTQIGKNFEAYVDNVVVKNTEEDKLIANLTKTFANLREFKWKLNPTKCIFGVPSGLLLGLMVRYRDIEANPAKIDAIRKMAKPSNNKDVMKLTGMMEALGRFISNLGEKGLPFFKLLKKADKFVWENQAQKAFEALKESLTTPPVMTPPIPKETLLLYISATSNVVSMVLVAEREEEGQAYPVQRLVYYASDVLADAKTHYTQPQKLIYALLITSRKLQHYFQAHNIVVPSSFPLGEIIRNRDANDRIITWSVKLGEFEIEFCLRQAIKSPILADFVSEWTEIQMPPPKERPEHWIMYLTSREQAQACYLSLLRESSSSMSCKFITRPPTTVQNMKP
jgi:hypothetical protein